MDLLQECAPPLFGRTIHSIKRKIIAPNTVAGHPANHAFHHALGRVSEQKINGAGGSISANGRDLPQLLGKFVFNAPSASTVKLTPGMKTRSKKPLRIAGNPSFQTG